MPACWARDAVSRAVFQAGLESSVQLSSELLIEEVSWEVRLVQFVHGEWGVVAEDSLGEVEGEN